MVDFGDAVLKGLKFAVEPKRWLPLFALDATVLGVAIYAFLINMSGFMDLFAGVENNPMAWAQFGAIILWMIIGILIWYILRMYVMASLIHQSRRPKEVDKAYRISLSRLPRVLVSIIIVSLISGLVGAIPVVGWIFSIVMGIAFFFVLQGIMIDDLGVISTLKNSWRMFRKKPIDVFIAWLLIALISTLIFGLFALPLIASFFGLFIGAISSTGMMDSGTMALFFVYLQENTAYIFLVGLVAVFGMDISQVFSIKAQTEVYLQMRSRFPSIIKSFARKAGKFF